MKVYVDTNVFIDYLLNRFKINLFTEAITCKYTLVVSHLVIKELTYQKVDFDELFKWLSFGSKIEIIPVVTDNYQKYIVNDECADAIHIACAVSANVECIVTRNVKDFRKSPITVKNPDDL